MGKQFYEARHWWLLYIHINNISPWWRKNNRSPKRSTSIPNDMPCRPKVQRNKNPPIETNFWFWYIHILFSQTVLLRSTSFFLQVCFLKEGFLHQNNVCVPYFPHLATCHTHRTPLNFSSFVYLSDHNLTPAIWTEQLLLQFMWSFFFYVYHLVVSDLQYEKTKFRQYS